MRLSARRLALIVFAAAGLAVGATFAMYSMLSESGLALGYSGMFLPTILFFAVCPALLLDAGVLAIRRRPATLAELVILGILVASILFVGLLMAAERFWGEMSFDIYGPSWMAIPICAVASLVVIIVATIRGPRPDAADVTRSELSAREADPTR